MQCRYQNWNVAWNRKALRYSMTNSILRRICSKYIHKYNTFTILTYFDIFCRQPLLCNPSSDFLVGKSGKSAQNRGKIKYFYIYHFWNCDKG